MKHLEYAGFDTGLISVMRKREREGRVLRDLRLDIKAMLDDDMQMVAADLPTGLASKKYRRFAKKLTK